MTKIQVYQLVAIIVLVIFVVLSYQQGSRNDFLFYPIIGVNLFLWILRQRERRQQKEMADDVQ